MNGIITSKIFPNFSFNTLDSGISPHKGHQLTLGMEFAGLGGTVRSVRPIVQYKQFIPVQNRRNAIGYTINGSFISGYGGLVAPPFQRFFMGGENDIRGFDIRSISPVAFLPSSNVITLTNPDGTPVPKNPANPRQGNWTVPIPGRPDRVSRRRSQCVDESGIPHHDCRTGGHGSLRRHRHRPHHPAFPTANRYGAIRPGDWARYFGCPTLDAGYNCQGGAILNPKPSQDLAGTALDELEVRMSTGTRTANVPSGSECALPHLLGL